MAAGWFDLLRRFSVPPAPLGVHKTGDGPRLGLHLFEYPGGPLIADFSGMAEGVVFADNEHGHESMMVDVRLSVREAFRYYAMVPTAHAVLSIGLGTVWAGRVEDRNLTATGLQMQALGYQRALRDAPYTALWSDTKYGGWRPLTGDELANRLPARWNLDNNNRLYFSIKKGATYQHQNQVGSWLYECPHNGDLAALEIVFTYEYDLPVDWSLHLLSATEGFAVTTNEWTVTSTGAAVGPTAKTVTLGAERPLIAFEVFNDTGADWPGAGSSPEDGDKFVKITGIRVKGTTAANVYADAIAAALVAHINGINATQLKAITGLLQSPGLDLQNEIYADEYPADILNSLAARGNGSDQLYEWGVNSERVLYFRPRNSRARAWYIDVFDPVAVSSTLETMYNSAYGVYKNEGGRVLRTAVSTDSLKVKLYGVTRRMPVTVSTTSQTQAEIQRDTVLAERKTMAPQASVSMDGRIYTAAGVRMPGWELRPGDYLTIRNLPPDLSTDIDRIRTFRVIRREMNPLTGSLSVTPEYEAPTLENLVTQALTPAPPEDAFITG